MENTPSRESSGQGKRAMSPRTRSTPKPSRINHSRARRTAQGAHASRLAATVGIECSSWIAVRAIEIRKGERAHLPGQPVGALTEAGRVARKGLLLGVLNRWSLLMLRRRLSGQTLWQSARPLSLLQLRRLVHQSVGKRVQNWRWDYALTPAPSISPLSHVFADFLGMAVRLEDAQ